MEQNAQITLDQAEAGGEQERPLSQTSPLQTLQPEPLPTQGQVPAETELPSIDFQSNSTDARREEPDHTDEPEQRQSQPENEQPEAIDDTTQAESQQTAWSAQESSVPEPKPTTVATKLESEATEEPAEFLREPSEIVEEQQSSRDITKLDDVTEAASAIEAEASEKPPQGRSVEQLAVASDPSSEAGSEPQAPLDDTLETIDEPRTALTENLIDTKPLSTVSNEEADIEATEVVTAESAVTEADFALFEDQVYTANVGPEPEPEQHRDSSAIVSNALDQNTALQPSDGGAPGFENLAPTDAADRVLGAAEPTPESSFGPVMDDSLSNMENLQEETVPPPEIDDVDAAYEEKIRSDAVEIDYYS
ncbi:hypothetical protein MTO96_033886 [Rhipicephalus appendiculatus]